MKKHLFFTAAVLAALTLPAVARDLRPFVMAQNVKLIPAATNSPGSYGAYFMTRLTVLNVTSHFYVVDVMLHTKFGVESLTSIPLSAEGSYHSENVLQDLFGYQGAGALSLSADGDSDHFIVTAEVYTNSLGGQYKTGVSGDILDKANLAADAYSAGVFVDSRRRTNAGCFNLGMSDQLVTVTVRDSAGTAKASHSLFVAGVGWNQISIPTPVYAGHLQFSTSRWADAGVYCYGVVVDNASNDGTFIPASPAR